MQATRRCGLGQDFMLVAEAKHKVRTVPKANEIKPSVRLSVQQAPYEDTTGNMGEDLPPVQYSCLLLSANPTYAEEQREGSDGPQPKAFPEALFK